LNILFLILLKIEDINERGIYTDLIRELVKRGINMYVICPREKRTNLKTQLVADGNISVLKVSVGNITETNFIEKGISTLLIDRLYLNAAKFYFKDISFDMVIYSTPPITFCKTISYVKSLCKCKTYLILKDIFPQNAVDIGAILKGGAIWSYFRKKEKKLYNISDYIGCMSNGNLEYLIRHNSYLDKSKIEVFPNSIKPVEAIISKSACKIKSKRLLQKFNIPYSKVVFLFGGNLGKPQGIDFLLKVVENFWRIENGFFLICGYGTEYKRIRDFIQDNQIKNVVLVRKLPKEDYDRLLCIADVGLIFLDKRFSIPNFPSRLNSYMEYAVPVLAATDASTDLKDIIRNSKSGIWIESGKLESFILFARVLARNKDIRINMGINGRSYLKDNFDVSKNVDIILKHLG
jgi:glycosyltransferase involved in cell wall biosynthesis